MAIDFLNGKAGVFFKRGTYAGYKAIANKNADTIYITTDDGGIYLGDKRLGDYVTIASIASLPGATTVSTSALYYAEKENVLARSNGTNWVQINSAGLTDIEQTTGDIVTGVSVNTDANGQARIVSVSRTNLADHATFKDVADRLGVAEQTISSLTGGDGTQSIASQIEAAVAPVRKAATDAQSTADGAVSVNTEQANTLTNHGGRIEAVETAVNTTLPNAINTAKSDLLGTDNDVAGANTIKGANKAAAAAQSKADENAGLISEQAGTLTNHEGRIAANELAITTLNGNDTVVGSVDYKVAQEVAKILNDNDPSDIDTLNEIAAWIKNDTAGVGALNQKVTDNTNAINNHTGRIEAVETAVNTTLPNAITKVQTDLVDSATTYNTFKKVETDLSAVMTKANDNATDISENAGAITNLTARVEANETAVTTTLPNAIAAAKTAVLGAANYGQTVKSAYELAESAEDIADGAVSKNTEQDGRLNNAEGRLDDIEKTLVDHLTWGTF